MRVRGRVRGRRRGRGKRKKSARCEEGWGKGVANNKRRYNDPKEARTDISEREGGEGERGRERDECQNALLQVGCYYSSHTAFELLGRTEGEREECEKNGGDRREGDVSP